MTAGHSHAPTTSENGSPADSRRRLRLAFGITALIVMAQAVGSVVTGSLALLTDTAHALTDATGLLVALVAATLALRPADARRTWGYRRIEVIAALGQAALLLVVGTYTAIEGVRRLFEPPEVQASGLLVFGIIGLAANVVAIALLASTRSANFNMRAAFLEVLNDALGSLGVIVAAIVISTTGFQQADAVAALLIAALIVPRAFTLMRETAAVLMEYTPPGLDLDEVRRHILRLDHVLAVHDLHATTVATGLPSLTGHVVLRDDCFNNGCAVAVLRDIRTCVGEHFGVSVRHSTFQLETEEIRSGEPADLTHP